MRNQKTTLSSATSSATSSAGSVTAENLKLDEKLLTRSPVPKLGGNTFYFTIKRAFDLSAACFLLIVLSPLFLIIALLIMLDTRGPVFYKQERIGSKRISIDGKTMWVIFPFTMYKFRSMVDGAPSQIHREFVKAFIQNDVDTMQAINKSTTAQASNQNTEEDTEFKIKADPRITRIGKYIRKASIDELPQLINVVRGEMSLVGPRPALRYEVEEYEDWHMQRFASQQGITGYWQVAGRSAVSFDRMVELDIWYAKHQSLFVDLKILLLTPAEVFKGRGAK